MLEMGRWREEGKKASKTLLIDLSSSLSVQKYKHSMSWWIWIGMSYPIIMINSLYQRVPSKRPFRVFSSQGMPFCCWRTRGSLPCHASEQSVWKSLICHCPIVLDSLVVELSTRGTWGEVDAPAQMEELICHKW